MLCEKCHKNEATTHIKRVINGQASEVYLCADCAAKAGFGSIHSPFSLGLNDLLGSVFGEAAHSKAIPAGGDEVRCSGCGSTFQDIAATGRAGCAKCYDTFYDQLLPSLQRLHGKTRHAGKLPASAGVEAKQRRQLDELRKALSLAVEKQEFEKAAALRDEIKALEQGLNQ